MATMTTTEPDTMKCVSCNCTHHAKTDIFGNSKEGEAGRDYDAREIFGVVATCPICLEECTEIVALPCGHVLCKTDYEKLGGHVKSMQINHNNNNDDEEDDDSTTKMLIHIRKAGQHGVNGTYRRHHHDKNRYTSMGRYDGKDVEYYIELRNNNNGEKYWYLSAVDNCNPNDAPTDFYKARVNLRFGYPCHVLWESATLYGTFPAPKASMSRLDM